MVGIAARWGRAKNDKGEKPMTPPLLKAALWYAKNGIPVFPCKPGGKEPLTPHGFKDATTDLARITEYWGRWPDANIGIPTGATTGLLVVDCDPRNGGPVDRSSFVELFGPVPETAEVITGGGGRHFFFRYPGGAVPKTLAKGVDLKGDGGYVVAPPSIHPSGGQYLVDGIAGARAFLQVAAAPAWLIERLNGGAKTREESVRNGGEWGAGARNNKLASRAGAMRRNGFSRETIEAALLEENRQRCDPPLADDEVRRIAGSVARYEPVHESSGQSAPMESFNLVHLGDLLDEPEEVKDWVMEGVLPAGGLSLLAGKPKAGKSTWARCLALAVSRGHEFLGKNTAQGPVLYLALEEKRNEVRKHFKALGASGNEPILIHADRAPAQAVSAAQRIIEQHKPSLVIVDPLLKFARVKDANDYAQVTAALEPLLALARESGAHVILVYHAGKGKAVDVVDSALGSTAFAAAVDTMLILKRTERYRTLETVQRYGEDLPETVLNFDLERRAVSLGVTRTEAEATRVADNIIGCVKDRSGLTEPEICDAVDGRLAGKRATLRELLGRGRVLREGNGKKGDPYRYSIARQSSFPDSPGAVGTREQESEKPTETAETEQPILVPDKSSGDAGTGTVQEQASAGTYDESSEKMAELEL